MGWASATMFMLAALASTECTSGGFICQDDAQCEGAGPQPRCEAEGACSFADEDCDSGRRYASGGGAAAGECVPAAGSSSTGVVPPLPTSSSSAGPSPESTGDEPGTTLAVDASDGTSGGPLDTGGSTTGPVPEVEICDGLDNDLDGLVDEISRANRSCGGCALAQRAASAYWVCPPGLSWAESGALCQGWGAELAKVESEVENEFLVMSAPGGAALWLGADDIRTEGSWSWFDGSPLPQAHSAWASGQPDDDGPTKLGEDCLHLTSMSMFFPGDWNDDDCERTDYGLACEAQHRL